MRLLALQQDWRYGVLELGQQICREEIGQAAVDVAVFVTICTAKAVLIITAPVWILPYAIWRKGRKQ